MGMALVSILAGVGIVVIVGAVVAFLGNSIMGAFNKPEIKPEEKHKEVISYEEYKRLEELKNQKEVEVSKQDEFDFESLKKEKEEIAQTDSESNKEELDLFSLDDDNDEDEIKSLEERLKAASINKEGAKEDDFDIDSAIDEIATEVADEEQKQINKNESLVGDSIKEYSLEKFLNEQTEEPEEVEETEELIEEPVDDEQNDEKVEIVEAQNELLNLQKEQAEEENRASRKIIEDLKAQLAELNKKLEDERNNKVETVEVVTIDMTEQQCLDRIATLEERLKNVKKDYKINAKEYRPLKKVMKDLEKFQTKLRRKDALVAKKKVALYGVNNYVDIDKEKAEKLANELELLDGLRLSVSHCEEVINANKDRFPILEHTNNILEDQIAQIEADLEQARLTLEKIRERDGKGESEK